MSTSTWNAQPDSGEWNTTANWSPSGVPTGRAGFASSRATAIRFSAASAARVEAIEFAEDASAYTFTFGACASPALTIAGEGVTNRSGRLQSFIVAATTSGYANPQLQFVNSASAGSDNMFYCAGPESEQGYGGGVICFHDNSTAGSASFKAWTGAGVPPRHNTVGGEIAFCDSSSAGNARFTIYGSLGDDGDTFGNVVFHDNATAANASFTNIGGTVSGGDGGNTQFYGDSTAACGVYNNWGGSHEKANGGDVAFDATATGGQGRFHNFAAPVAGAYGGVTSFNNNPPHMNAQQGASAGNGTYINYGAREGEHGGGGHVEFSARYGSPSAANACIVNYGSAIARKSSAGHTIFCINLPTEYFPTAANANIWNHPAAAEGAAAGYTQFSVYGTGSAGSHHVPTAGNATLFNLGGYTDKAGGGYTVFSGESSAGNARLIAYGGSNGGHGGRIAFCGVSSGGTARIELHGNAELDIGDHSGGLTVGELSLSGGVICVELGGEATALGVSGNFHLDSTHTRFSFREKENGGFAFDTAYTILTNANLSSFSTDRFLGNSLEGVEPTFAIVGNDLQVRFMRG